MGLTSYFFHSDAADSNVSPKATVEHERSSQWEQPDRWIAHPLFILRIAGEPVDAIAGMNRGTTVDRLIASAAAGEAAQRLASSVCALLESVYPRLESRELKNALVAVKRDLYNLRMPRPKALDLVLESLADAERASVAAMLRALEEVSSAEAEAEAAYHEECRFIFSQLTQRFSSHKLRDELQRSNPLLVEKLDRLRAGRAVSERDSVSLGLALFSYFHRAALKTSPRSSLTLVAPGRWSPERPVGADQLALPQLRIERSSSARHGLVERLFQPLLQDRAALGPEASIGINATARIAADHLEWRRVLKTEVPSQEVYGITEATSRVKVSRGLELLLKLFADAQGERIPLGTLDAALKRHLPAGAWGGIPVLVGAALSHGILDASPLVPEQADKLLWAKSALAQLEEQLAERLRPPLLRFESAIEACRISAGAESMPAYRSLEESFGELAEAAGSRFAVESVRPIVHEDCKVAAPALHLHPDALGGAREDLPALLCLLPLLRGYGWPQFWLTARFLEAFGAGGCCDDPEAFLLAAAHDLGTPEGEASNAPRREQLGQPPAHPAALAADAVAQSFLAALTAANEGASERRIPLDLIRGHYSALPEAIRRRSRSHTLNAQRLRDAGEDRLMINAIYSGNSRIMSRFIGDDPRQLAATREYLGRLAGGDYAAVPGVFGFNANIHPPLAETELGLPPRPEDFGGSKVVPLRELRIVYDEKEARIVLVNSRGKKIEPFFFGMLNPRGLPPVHRMLDWMSGAADNLLSIARSLSVGGPRGAGGVVVQPRIALGRLVLTRRAHVVPISLLPDPRADEYRFFVDFQAFHSKWEIPRETFYRFHGGEVVDSGNEGLKQRAPKWRKPMHLDAHNPVAVRTLQRALRRYEGTVDFAEALPVPDTAPLTVDGAKHVSELTLEIGLRAR